MTTIGHFDRAQALQRPGATRGRGMVECREPVACSLLLTCARLLLSAEISRTKSAATWLISSFPALRRAHVTMGTNKTLHSIRHRFQDVLDNAGIPIERQRVLVGHASGDVQANTGPDPPSGTLTRMSVLCDLSRIETDRRLSEGSM